MPTRSSARFVPSLRQKRLRMAALAILLVVLGMVGFGTVHPFFRIVASPSVTELAREGIRKHREGAPLTPAERRARDAVRTKLIAVYGYWTVCFVLTGGAVLIAWLDIREVQRRLAEEHIAAMRELAEAARKERTRNQAKGDGGH